MNPQMLVGAGAFLHIDYDTLLFERMMGTPAKLSRQISGTLPSTACHRGDMQVPKDCAEPQISSPMTAAYTLRTQVLPMENERGRDRVEGRNLCERKNGRGVDTNRNWPVHWGFKEPDYDAREEFPGEEPFRCAQNLSLGQHP